METATEPPAGPGGGSPAGAPAVCPVDDVLDLRARVLRAGRAPAAARLDGDEDPGTVAFAARGPAGEPVATATLMDQPCPWRPAARALRLRAMATDPAVRGTGVGAAVLVTATKHARDAGVELLWCHARVSAAGFYARAGWVVDGGEFDVAGIGAHVHLELDLRP